MTSTPRLKVAFYGDDFTGATDNAAQYARHGLKTVLFFQNPGLAALHEASKTHDVIGIAGTARSLACDAMAAEIEPVLDAFVALTPPLIQYKCCSTFDSSPQVGSLGEAVRLMRLRWPERFIPVLAAMPEFGRYTVFGQHFAVFKGTVYRLDRHPTMSRHPITPMHESDLGLILGEQGFDVSRVVNVNVLDAGDGALDVMAAKLARDGNEAIFDALTNTQLTASASIIWKIARTRGVAALAAQGLGHGLGQYLRGENASGGDDAPLRAQCLAPTDRILVLSGSCSPQSALQIEWARNQGFREVRLSVEALSGDLKRLSAHEDDISAALRTGQSVVAYTALGADDPAAKVLNQRMQADPGWIHRATGDTSFADHLGAVFARLARRAIVDAGISRLAVAGGDSSSFAMRHLGASGFAMQASHFGQNIHIGRLVSEDARIEGTEILLKGGQVGHDDVYGLLRDGFDITE